MRKKKATLKITIYLLVFKLFEGVLRVNFLSRKK